ncbi:hypothetical protein EK21DRAFT_61774 [Setomelanomma holmii]|uniref:Uncharacterized protein n=1 Tax=Setomelanomma holmii TaxID=210430 RepID=A0A9P4HDJ6_9PLEO|nr:hypothetical protein EK21DRAFT_61774 [Setomelanomma holmii]
MELYRPRSSSIPRNHRQIPFDKRFTVADAAQLKLKLQALDDNLDRHVDIATLKSACQSRPFHEEIYMDGSEEFFMLVHSLMRADLIPDVYVEAYATVQQGRFHLNRYRVSDFKKGVDPTFSQVRPLLEKIDELCGTKLDQSYRLLEDEGKSTHPWCLSLLTRSTELRLEIYSHLIPREPHIAVIAQPHRDHKPPRLSLDILRINRRLHDEGARHFYENRTLFMVAARDKQSELLSNEFVLRYCETVAMMATSTRLLFTTLEIQIGYFSDQKFTGRHPSCEKLPSGIIPVQHIFALLPNLKSVVISFALAPAQIVRSNARIAQQQNDTLEWLLAHIPQDVELLWDEISLWDDIPEVPPQTSVCEGELFELMHSRGPPQQGRSVAAQLAIERREKTRRQYVFVETKSVG